MAFKKVENEAVTIGFEELSLPFVTGHLLGFRLIDGGHGPRPQPVLVIDGNPRLVFCGAEAVQKLMPLTRGVLTRITAVEEQKNGKGTGKHARRALSGARQMKGYDVEVDDADHIVLQVEWLADLRGREIDPEDVS